MIGKIGGFTATVFLGSWGKMVCAFMNKEMERGRDRFWKFWELSPNTGLSHNALIDVNREYIAVPCLKQTFPMKTCVPNNNKLYLHFAGKFIA